MAGGRMDTRIFSPAKPTPELLNQPLATLVSRSQATKAQLRHTQSELGTFLAQDPVTHSIAIARVYQHVND